MKTPLEQLYNSAAESILKKDYKKAYSNCKKLSRSGLASKVIFIILEAEALMGMEKWDKATIVLSTFSGLVATKEEQVKIYNLLASAYTFLENDNEAIEHLQKSIELDGTINNAQARYELLAYYCHIDVLDKAEEIGEKLLDWRGFVLSALVYLLDVAVKNKDRNKVNKRVNLIIHYFKEIDPAHIKDICFKLINAKMFEAADDLINKDRLHNNKNLWQETALAIIQLKNGQYRKAIRLFRSSDNSKDSDLFYFYTALQNYFYDNNQIENFLSLQKDFSDHAFHIVLIRELLNLGYIEQVNDLFLKIKSPEHLQHIAPLSALISNWLLSNITNCEVIIKNNPRLISGGGLPADALQAIAFFNLIKKLINHNKKKPGLKAITAVEDIYVIGESHSLGLNNRIFKCHDNYYKGKTKFILSIQMFDLANSSSKKIKYLFNKQLASITTNANILFAIGELDCRMDKGIYKAAKKSNRSIEEVVNNTVTAYIDYLIKGLKAKSVKNVIVQGVPASNIKKSNQQDFEMHNHVIHCVNLKLEELTLLQGWTFIDLYNATADTNGQCNKKWHIDDVHLKPSIYDDITPWAVKMNNI